MSERSRQLLQELLALDLAERIAVADQLVESIDAELPAVAEDDDQEEADHRLLLQRVAEADAHPELLIDGDQAMREIREYARTKMRP